MWVDFIENVIFSFLNYHNLISKPRVSEEGSRRERERERERETDRGDFLTVTTMEGNHTCMSLSGNSIDQLFSQ